MEPKHIPLKEIRKEGGRREGRKEGGKEVWKDGALPYCKTSSSKFRRNEENRDPPLGDHHRGGWLKRVGGCRGLPVESWEGLGGPCTLRTLPPTHSPLTKRERWIWGRDAWQARRTRPTLPGAGTGRTLSLPKKIRWEERLGFWGLVWVRWWENIRWTRMRSSQKERLSGGQRPRDTEHFEH